MMETNFSLIWLVLFIPLFGAIVSAIFGKSIVDKLGIAGGRRVVGALACVFVLIPFLIGIWLTYQLAVGGASQAHMLTLFEWIRVYGLSIPFEVRVDTLSMTMVLIITGVGTLIHLYATGYMKDDPDYPRFFCYLNLFIAFMLILVLGNNLPMLFIGWEGVGLASYLLIGFWYKEKANSLAANKAFIVNRIGDVGLILAMGLIIVLFATSRETVGIDSDRWLSFDVIIPNAMAVLQGQPWMATAIALLLFVGAAGKSAQFPLYIWLPDAMAGPTPVSALIHAATMVTAGIYLLNRLYIFFALSPVASTVVICVAAFTAMFAAVIALTQTDIKKVLAYSTVSQLGFMFIACGAGAYWAGMFHVTTHAFFKATLFLGAGSVIVAMAHNQDLRNYGKLGKALPITCAAMIVGAASLAAIPFVTAGFWSKESVLGAAFGNQLAVVDGVNFSAFAGWVGLAAAVLTAFYSTRLIWLTFFGNKQRWLDIEPSHAHAHDHGLHESHEGEPELAPAYALEGPSEKPHHDDPFHFYYTDDEVRARQEQIAATEEHHHDLDRNWKPKEVLPSMWLPVGILAVLSTAITGYFLYSNHLLEHWLYPEGLMHLTKEQIYGKPKSMPYFSLEVWSILAASLGVVVGLITYWKGLPKREGWDESKWRPWRRAAYDQFGYDRLMTEASVEGGGALARFTWKVIDVRIIDGIVNGTAKLVGGIGLGFSKIQTGFVRTYALVTLMGIVTFLGWLFYMINWGWRG
ncbi:MAG: NADH-quinone oxidoreductase subunit L [Fimbriimonadaceae bacterium]